MHIPVDSRHDVALQRYQCIAPLLDSDLEAAAGRVWRDQICEREAISQRTLRRWLQSYRQDGLDGLYPKERCDKGVPRTMNAEALALATELRKELPSRSARRICELLKMRGHKVARSTLERHLRQRGLSKRALKREMPQGNTAGRRFQHEHRNSLWQSDFKAGIRIPDPQNAGQYLETQLLVFLDDATRKVIHAEFYVDQTTQSLMDGLRKALLSAGTPKKLYVDNGRQFVSVQIQLICARLGIRHVTTQPYSPEAKGKVEHFNRTVEEFMQEARLEPPLTLRQLNHLLWQWI